MTDYAVVPRQSLYKVSPKVPSHIGALAEPLSCVVNAFDKLAMRPGESALVLGAGPIGLLFTSLFKSSGAAKLIVSEPSEYRRRAASDCGAGIVVDPKKEDLAKRIMAFRDSVCRPMPGLSSMGISVSPKCDCPSGPV